MQPIEYCEDKVAKPGSSLYYALLFTPTRWRVRLLAVHTLDHELKSCVDTCSDPNLGRTKLGWWLEELLRTTQGVPNHPITQLLTDEVELDAHAVRALQRLGRGYAAHLETPIYATTAALDQYATDTTGVVFELEARMCATRPLSDHDLESARMMGAGVGLARAIRFPFVTTWRSAGVLPQALLAKHALQASALRASPPRRDAHGPYVELSTLARHKLSQSLREHRDTAHRSLTAGIILANIECVTLNAFQRSNYAHSSRAATVSPLRKLWTAWRHSS